MYSTRSKRKLNKPRSKTSRLAGNATKRRKNSDVNGKTESKDKKATRGSGNVFEDLGFEPAEAANLKIRADLMVDLRRHIQKKGWTQAQAAQFFGETQPRISNLLKGEINRFSVDKLINMLAKAGIAVVVETKLHAA